jgi:uncharacterized membrane protein HdeD (DUF308 family)
MPPIHLPSWLALAFRGVAAILFGILMLIFPPGAVTVLVMFFGAYAVVDGAFNLAGAVRAPREGKRWGALAVEGIVSLLAGLVAIFWPGITALAFVALIAAWSLVTGIAEIVAAIRLRKVIRREWLLILSGVLSVAFGVLLVVAPVAGIVVIAIWMGAYAIAFGTLLLMLALRLRSISRTTALPHIPQTA